MAKVSVTTGASWEDSVGYCRAIRHGNTIEIAGTTAVVDGKIAGKNDAYEQTKIIFGIIEDALTQLGAKMSDVVRTRMYLKNIHDWEAVGKAHGEIFRTIKPVSTMLAVAALIDPDMLVEIEVTAILS
ncbi:MAG TPA: RidA family protein [Saprospiraceae bacterium]|nr:RidA family protein [Saprospiraceae bacterium]HMT69018.1 RidA family protein [Saprospiraceae bacterium]